MGTDQFNAGLGRAMHAEQQVARIIPQVMLSVSSQELSRTLRQALTVSEHYQTKQQPPFFWKNWQSGYFSDSFRGTLLWPDPL